jgi:hypothetical protein
MSDNNGFEKNKIRDTVLSALKEIRHLRNVNHKDNAYNALLDTTYDAKISDDDMVIHGVAPIKRTICEHLVLVHKARNIMSEYLTMKSFILDVYALQIAKNIGLRDVPSQQKMRIDIKNEMEENFKNLTNLSARLASEKGSALDKDLVHIELKALTHDLSYRLGAYQPYYQSYLADNHCESQLLYEMT